MTSLQIAKNALFKNGYTCVIFSGKTKIYSSYEHGVKPLLDFAMRRQKVKNLVLADRIIGSGAAFLAVSAGITAVYTPVVSKKARAILKKYYIALEYQTAVPYIINRDGTGCCPIEQRLAGIDDVSSAVKTIVRGIAELDPNQ